MISACRDHVGHNAHTSKRIKHKKMNRFKKFGGATPCEIYGYVKPPGAKTYDDWQKDEAATEIYAEWFRILRETLNCSAVADWLNGQGVPIGQYSRRHDLGRGDGPADHRATRCSRGCPAAGSSTPSSTTRPAGGSRSRTPRGRCSASIPTWPTWTRLSSTRSTRGSTRPTRGAAASPSTGSTPAAGCRASGPGSPASTPAAGTAAASSSGAATA